MIVMMPSISKTRQNLFSMVEQAAKGEKVEFVHNGQVFQIVPVDRPSKLSRLRAMKVIPDGTSFEDLDHARRDMRKEIMDAWEHNNQP